MSAFLIARAKLFRNRLWPMGWPALLTKTHSGTWAHFLFNVCSYLSARTKNRKRLH